MTESKDRPSILRVKTTIHRRAVCGLVLYFLAAISGQSLSQDRPSIPDEPGFGVGGVEVGFGVAPLGLTSENDLDVLVEFGGFVSIVSRNPDGFILRFSGSYGTTNVNAPSELLSAGPVNITRFDASILYGSYFYGGLGIGYALLDHTLGDDALDVFAKRGQRAEESIDNAVYYIARVGVRSEGKVGYFVEGVFSLMEPQVHASVVDLPTGNTATTTWPMELNIIHFFHLGIAYRF